MTLTIVLSRTGRGGRVDLGRLLATPYGVNGVFGLSTVSVLSLLHIVRGLKRVGVVEATNLSVVQVLSSGSFRSYISVCCTALRRRG